MCLCVCMHAYVCMCVHACVCVCACICVCACACVSVKCGLQEDGMYPTHTHEHGKHTFHM